ncbi:hypothetical protein IFM89_030582 [Coptis chinensis]|uniref:Uncharacterized protein n=1 Tax=Coptis chinensis TaxID=261450 RepID=A0A835LTD6_9MAGN|nr:hypothetical protein IFM89_030582 [Coptis chinensis]
MDRLEVVGLKMNLYAIKEYLDEAFIGIVSHFNNIEKRIQVIKEKKKFANDANITDLTEDIVEPNQTPMPMQQLASDVSPVTPGLMKETMKRKEKVEYLGDVEVPSYTHCYFHYMDKVPEVVRPFTLDIEKPMEDGTGGFMALALALGYRKENWIKVQVDLLVELNCFKQEYVKMFSVHGFKNCVENLSKSGTDEFMMMLEAGYLAASKYHAAVVFFSEEKSVTFLPLRSAIPKSGPKVISIGLVENKMLKLKLKTNYPMPEIAKLWFDYYYPTNGDWETYFQSHFDAYKKVVELRNDVLRVAIRIGDHEKKLKLLCEKKGTIEQEICDMQGKVESIDPQRKLALPDPVLPTEKNIPPGFLGEPKIQFPGCAAEVQRRLYPRTVNILRKIVLGKLELEITYDEIEKERKAHSEELRNFHEKKNHYQNFMNANERTEFHECKRVSSSCCLYFN